MPRRLAFRLRFPERDIPVWAARYSYAGSDDDLLDGVEWPTASTILHFCDARPLLEGEPGLSASRVTLKRRRRLRGPSRGRAVRHGSGAPLTPCPTSSHAPYLVNANDDLTYTYLPLYPNGEAAAQGKVPKLLL